MRVDEPGNGTPVGQENHAEADAAASASATTGTSGTANVDQDVQANADGTQSDVGNTAVTVRVGSPGDDGAVSQSNVAAATAATTSDNAGNEAANASAGQDGVANTSVSIRVFSPGDDGSVTQSNQASASAHTSNGSGADAAASQDDVRNTSVSIRVESPGTTGPVSQANDATASADGVAVAVSNDAVNTVVAVAVGATDLDRPGPTGLQVWVWEWVWERDESESLQGAIGADVTSWVWDWGKNGPKHGTVTSRAAGDDDGGRKAGSWEWRWDWDRQGVAGMVVELGLEPVARMRIVHLGLELVVELERTTGRNHRATGACTGWKHSNRPAQRGSCRGRRRSRGSGRPERDAGRRRRRHPVPRPVGRRHAERRSGRDRHPDGHRVVRVGLRPRSASPTSPRASPPPSSRRR